MKKLMIIIIALSTIGVLNAKDTGEQPINEDNTKTSDLQILPYAKTQITPMTALASNNEYTVYRVESDFVKQLPSCKPVGKKYNYFVYKNGNFHLTVNQCNKDKVFKFFTN